MRKDRTFYQLDEEKGNKYRVKETLERTLEGTNMIPFLRASSQTNRRAKRQSWNDRVNGYPIARYNE